MEMAFQSPAGRSRRNFSSTALPSASSSARIVRPGGPSRPFAARVVTPNVSSPVVAIDENVVVVNAQIEELARPAAGEIGRHRLVLSAIRWICTDPAREGGADKHLQRPPASELVEDGEHFGTVGRSKLHGAVEAAHAANVPRIQQRSCPPCGRCRPVTRRARRELPRVAVPAHAVERWSVRRRRRSRVVRPCRHGRRVPRLPLRAPGPRRRRATRGNRQLSARHQATAATAQPAHAPLPSSLAPPTPRLTRQCAPPEFALRRRAWLSRSRRGGGAAAPRASRSRCGG